MCGKVLNKNISIFMQKKTEQFYSNLGPIIFHLEKSFSCGFIRDSLQ